MIILRQETRLIKDILKSKYPEKKFKFRYKTASNYYDSSDTLIITCDGWMDVDEVISFIREYVSGIKVFRHGDIAFIHHRHINSRILSIKTNEWVEAGLMEFIEVRNE